MKNFTYKRDLAVDLTEYNLTTDVFDFAVKIYYMNSPKRPDIVKTFD